MTSESNDFSRKPDAKWIKGGSGAFYLCPSAILEFLDQFTEEELQDLCVRRSMDEHIN